MDDATGAMVTPRRLAAARLTAAWTTTTQATETRERLTRSREIYARIADALDAEVARRRRLMEAFARAGTAPPREDDDARADARATVDASSTVDLDAPDGDLSDVTNAKAALARSQAKARMTLAEASKTRARNDALEKALADAGVEIPRACE